MLPLASEAQRSPLTLRVSTRSVCLLAAIIGLAFTVACFFPGYMSPDSISQLGQGRTLSFTDWHPPVMSLLWGLLDRIAPGPAGMLILHNLIFWTGLSLFVYHLGFERGWAAAAILLVGLSPPVLALLSTIWKDVAMGCSLLLGCGLLLRAERSRSKIAWVMALVSLWYATAVRHNAIIAVTPLAIWAALIWGQLFQRKGGRLWLSVALRAFLLVMLLVVTSNGVNKLLSPGRSLYPLQTILVHDLVGVSLEINTLYLPEYLIAALPSADVSELRRLYTPNEVVPLFCCDGKGRFELTSDPDKLSRLWTVWRSVIPRHLRAYINHRTQVFRSEFAIGRATVCLPFWDGIDSNSLNLTFHSTALNRWVMRVLSRVKDGPLFWGWLYLAGLLILIGTLRLGFTQNSAPILIGISGLFYALAYFFVSATCDFRMHWWSVLSAFLLALLWISNTRNAARLMPAR